MIHFGVSLIKTRRADHLLNREYRVARLHRDFHSPRWEEVAGITAGKAFLSIRVILEPSVGACEFDCDFGHDYFLVLGFL